MPSLIERIKRALPLAPFVAPYTDGLKSTGRGFFIGRCPFHQSISDPPNKRKFWVSSQHNVCGCFVPRCPAYANHRADKSTKPLDIINFWSIYRDIPLNQAVGELAQQAGFNE